VTVILPLIVAWAASQAQAQESSSATLKSVVERARAANPDILAARKTWEMARAKVPSESAYPAPEIGVEYWGFSRSGLNAGSAEEKWYDVAQTVPFPGKLTLRGRAAAHAARREEEVYRAAERDVVSQVKQAYYDLLLAQHTVRVYEETAGILRRIAGIAESKYAVGKASQPSVLRAQVELSKTQNGAITAGQRRDTARAMLNSLLARPAETPVEAVEEPLVTAAPQNSDLERTALSNRPEVHAAGHHVDHMRAELAAQRADYLPDFMLQYTWRTRVGMPSDAVAVVKMTLPFLWFRRQQSIIRSTTAEKEHADAALTASRLKTAFEVRETATALDAARRSVELYRTTILPQAEQSLRVAESGYRADRLGFLDLLDAERVLVDSKLEYYKAVSDYGSRLAQLERVVGTELASASGGTDEHHH
jgi:outer membrane protein, heavy metal efflux system